MQIDRYFYQMKMKIKIFLSNENVFKCNNIFYQMKMYFNQILLPFGTIKV